MPFAKIEEDFSLYYDIDDFTDPWKEADTVVLQHGHGRNGRLWYAWVPLLGGEYKVLRPDLRGFGNSHYPESSYRFSFNTFANDLKKLLDTLQISKVNYVGETAGGVTGLHFAYLYPEYLKSLVLISTPYSLREHGQTLKAWVDIMTREGVEGGIRATMDYRFDTKKIAPHQVEWLAKEMSKTPLYVEKSFAEEASKLDFLDKLPQINVPTLILTSKVHQIISAKEARILHKSLPNSKLHILEGATALIAYTQPRQCAELVKSFWRKLDS